jgi:hypothetical protein
MKDENILAAHKGLSERKCQRIFKKKLLTDGIIILKQPIQGPTRCTFLCITYSSLFLVLHVSGAICTHSQ